VPQPIVAHPAEAFGEERADIVDPVVVEPVDHALDHRAGRVGLRHVGVAGQHRLLGRAPLMTSGSVPRRSISPPDRKDVGSSFHRSRREPADDLALEHHHQQEQGAVIDTAAATAST
jgi:hypothetical protein